MLDSHHNHRESRRHADGRSGDDPMTGRMSDEALAFVQHCQVAVGLAFPIGCLESVDTIWHCLQSFPDSHDEWDRIAAASAVWMIAAGFFDRQRPQAHPFHLKHAHIHDALNIIKSDHPDTNLNLRAIAKRLGLSYSYLSRTLTQETGHDFADQIGGVRVLAAVRLLKNSEWQIKEIAHRVGFSSTRELDRQMRRWFGVTPGTFRSLLSTSLGSSARPSSPW